MSISTAAHRIQAVDRRAPMSDSDTVDIGAGIDAAANEIFGDETDATDAQEGSGNGADADDGPSPGAIDQIGAAIRPALEYAHDVDDEPPVRSGPFPAGGPS
jgi:hypothetical protein